MKGLKARGGFEVSVAWKGSKPSAIEIRSLLGNPVVLRVPGNPSALTVQEKEGRRAKLAAENGTFRFPTKRGVTYQIRF
jgi:alpha-L-fucosidase 2